MGLAAYPAALGEDLAPDRRLIRASTLPGSARLSGTPVIAVSVPDVKDVNRRSIDGEEYAPGSPPPELHLPDLAGEGLAFRRDGVGFRQGFESEDCARMPSSHLAA